MDMRDKETMKQRVLDAFHFRHATKEVEKDL